MRITHFVENLERGGLERVVIDMIHAQRAAGHECRVICLFERGALANELTSHGVTVEPCGKRSGFDIAAVRRARMFLSQWPGGVLHTHNAAAHYHAVLASVGLHLQGTVNTRHGMGEANPRSRREWFYRQVMPLTDCTVAVCEAARQLFSANGVRPRSRLLSIPNGIPVERFNAASPEAHAQLAMQLKLPLSSRIIGTVGRLQAVKDQAALIQALPRVRERMPGVALVLIGDGPLRRDLEQVAHRENVTDAVRFLGDRNDVDRLLPGLDVFALSSLSEGYSVALLEACAVGLPIIATDVGGNREIVRDKINGLLVPSQNVSILASALVQMLQSPDAAKEMGRVGRTWALTEASVKTMTDRYLQLYTSLADTHREPSGRRAA